MRKETSMKVYQETIDPLPVVSSEPSDEGLFHRTISSLEQESTWLKERLARLLRNKSDRQFIIAQMTQTQRVANGK
jgi:hypothetical protein